MNFHLLCVGIGIFFRNETIIFGRIYFYTFNIILFTHERCQRNCLTIKYMCISEALPWLIYVHPLCDPFII